MPTFVALDWRRFDVWGIVGCRGLAVVRPDNHTACHAWLDRHGYLVDTLDFGGGIGPAIDTMNTLFRWEEQFGYLLGPDGNLNAIRDGFTFEFPPAVEGRVLELLNADVAWTEDGRWLLGLLSVASEYSHQQLALGNRFLTTLVLPPDHALPGWEIEKFVVPTHYQLVWTRNPFDGPE